MLFKSRYPNFKKISKIAFFLGAVLMIGGCGGGSGGNGASGGTGGSEGGGSNAQNPGIPIQASGRRKGDYYTYEVRSVTRKGAETSVSDNPQFFTVLVDEVKEDGSYTAIRVSDVRTLQFYDAENTLTRTALSWRSCELENLKTGPGYNLNAGYTWSAKGRVQCYFNSAKEVPETQDITGKVVGVEQVSGAFGSLALMKVVTDSVNEVLFSTGPVTKAKTHRECWYDEKTSAYFVCNNFSEPDANGVSLGNVTRLIGIDAKQYPQRIVGWERFYGKWTLALPGDETCQFSVDTDARARGMCSLKNSVVTTRGFVATITAEGVLAEIPNYYGQASNFEGRLGILNGEGTWGKGTTWTAQRQ